MLNQQGSRPKLANPLEKRWRYDPVLSSRFVSPLDQKRKGSSSLLDDKRQELFKMVISLHHCIMMTHLVKKKNRGSPTQLMTSSQIPHTNEWEFVDECENIIFVSYCFCNHFFPTRKQSQQSKHLCLLDGNYDKSKHEQTRSQMEVSHVCHCLAFPSAHLSASRGPKSL